MSKVTLSFDGAWAYLSGPGLVRPIKDELYELLSYQDKSKAYIAYKTGRNINTFVSCYDRKLNRFLAGFVQRVYYFLVKKGLEVEIESKIKPVEKVEPFLPDWLYEHQVKAISKMLSVPRCAVESPTGSGYN